MVVKHWEELNLPKKEVIPRELDRYMKTYRMRHNRLRDNDCFVSLSLCDFRK